MHVAVSRQHYAQAEQYRMKIAQLVEEKALAIEKEASKEPTGKVGDCLGLEFHIGAAFNVEDGGRVPCFIN